MTLSPLTHMVYLIPLLSYLTGSESVCVRPPIRHDDKYRSRRYHFDEWQKYQLAEKKKHLQYIGRLPLQIITSHRKYNKMISRKRHHINDHEIGKSLTTSINVISLNLSMRTKRPAEIFGTSNHNRDNNH